MAIRPKGIPGTGLCVCSHPHSSLGYVLNLRSGTFYKYSTFVIRYCIPQTVGELPVNVLELIVYRFKLVFKADRDGLGNMWSN